MKNCRVSFRDRGGIVHSVEVEAEHRFHAFGLAMHQMRRCSFCHPEYSGVEKLTLHLLDSRGQPVSQAIVVTRDQFEEWMAVKESALSAPERMRQYLKMLLGRIPPDREFQRAAGRR